MIYEGPVLIDDLGGSLNAVTNWQEIIFINQNFKCKQNKAILKIQYLKEICLYQVYPTVALHYIIVKLKNVWWELLGSWSWRK